MGNCSCAREQHNSVPNVFDAATREGSETGEVERWKPVQHETSYFDTLRDSFAFPAPRDASYTTDGPRTVHSIDQCKYYEVESAQRDWHNFSDFHAKYFLLPAHSSSQGFWNRAVPCIGFAHPSASQVLVWAHANAEDMWRAHRVLDCLRVQLRVHVIAFEYPGYAGAPGQPSEQSTCENADRVYHYLTHQQGFAPKDIIFLGRSLGSAILTQCAASNKVAALILLSPFTSIKSVVQHANGHSTLGGVAASLISDCFETIEAIKHVDTQLLVVHGQLDQLVPLEHGRQLVDAANSCHTKRLRVLEDMAHNDIFEDKHRTIVLDSIHNFLCRERVLRTVTSSSQRTELYPPDLNPYNIEPVRNR